jgi:hypothetical protein
VIRYRDHPLRADEQRRLIEVRQNRLNIERAKVAIVLGDDLVQSFGGHGSIILEPRLPTNLSDIAKGGDGATSDNVLNNGPTRIRTWDQGIMSPLL